jgi:hypothetical protein
LRQITSSEVHLGYNRPLPRRLNTTGPQAGSTPKPPDLPEGVGYVSNSPWAPLWLILVTALLVVAAAYYWIFRKLSIASQRQR